MYIKTSYSEEELDEISNFIEQKASSISDDEAYDALANGLYDLGYEVENDEDGDEAIDMFINPIELGNHALLGSPKAFINLQNRTELHGLVRGRRGRRFFARLRRKVKNAICNRESIAEWFKNLVGSSFKDFIKNVIPIVLAAIGLSINPIVTGIIIAAVILIIKTGYEAFCGVE
jgi:hypothetical protein